MPLGRVSSSYRQEAARTERLVGEAVNFSCRLSVVDAPDVAPIVRGGVLDTVRLVLSPASTPGADWPIGKGQAPVIRALLERQHRRIVVVGAMGSGKTEVLARAALVAALGVKRASIGLVAPTAKRSEILWGKIARLLPPDWVLEVRKSEGEITLVNRVRLQFVAAKEYSAAIGSPIQGQSWVAAFVDEEQDLTDESLANVELRGREAPGGWYPVVSTCTLKDTAEWRARRARYEQQPDALLYRMDARANPFVHASYWDRLKEVLSRRQYRLRVEALDAPPERATYPDFVRQVHCRPIPTVGVRDVTVGVCGKPLLVGYDPGRLQHVSIILKAFEVAGARRPWWWVVGEVTTDGATVDSHLVALLRRVKELVPGVQPSQQIQVVADPYGYGSDARPDVSTYLLWTEAGIRIRPAAYSRVRPDKPGSVPKDAAIEVVNHCLMSASGDVCLYVATDERGDVCAPRLVGALEMSERDLAGKAESERKSSTDLSHWPAALRYALWAYERYAPRQELIDAAR